MSGCRKGVQGFGRRSTTSHYRSRVLRGKIQGISRPVIRRLARRGGIRRITELIYDETRIALKNYLTRLVEDSMMITQRANRKTVTAMDILYALKREGKTLYGYGS